MKHTADITSETFDYFHIKRYYDIKDNCYPLYGDIITMGIL